MQSEFWRPSPVKLTNVSKRLNTVQLLRVIHCEFVTTKLVRICRKYEPGFRITIFADRHSRVAPNQILNSEVLYMKSLTSRRFEQYTLPVFWRRVYCSNCRDRHRLFLQPTLTLRDLHMVVPASLLFIYSFFLHVGC